MFEPVRLEIERLGRRGEGVSNTTGRHVYVPYALPGETVLADVEGDRGHLVDVLSARPDRLAPFCTYYGRCGGCAVQTLAPEPYAAWKRDLVVQALRQAGLDAEVGPLVDAHGAGRRRATAHVRFDPQSRPAGAQSRPAGAQSRPAEVGFMEARAHRIVNIENCPIFSPGLEGALPAARRLATMLAEVAKPLDILATATESGLDVDLRGLGPINEDLTRRLVTLARELDLARLSNHGDILVEARAPRLDMGGAILLLPPGAFLQATVLGEERLGELVRAGVGTARKVADLFCGVGTFTLRLARSAVVEAWDSEPKAVAALSRAALSVEALGQVRASVRDLVHRPLLAEELSGFDAVVFDPPRAGAAAQALQIAASGVPTVVAVSCDPGTFARDAATLVAGGYAIDQVTPVDQFRHAAHVEIVATFRRPRTRVKRRRLLS